MPQADGAEMTPLLCLPASVPFLCPRLQRMALRLAQHPARCRAVGLVSGAALPQETGGGGPRVRAARGPVCAGPSAGCSAQPVPGPSDAVVSVSWRDTRCPRGQQAALAGLSLRLDERG